MLARLDLSPAPDEVVRAEVPQVEDHLRGRGGARVGLGLAVEARPDGASHGGGSVDRL